MMNIIAIAQSIGNAAYERQMPDHEAAAAAYTISTQAALARLKEIEAEKRRMHGGGETVDLYFVGKDGDPLHVPVNRYQVAAVEAALEDAGYQPIEFDEYAWLRLMTAPVQDDMFPEHIERLSQLVQDAR